jgi:DNA-binding NarL/FixJ family response regulator
VVFVPEMLHRDRIKARLLVADDHEESLSELVNLLTGEFDIAGVARDGAKLIELAGSLRPDVIVTDLQMPKLNGIKATRELLQRQLCTAVVIVTVNGDPQLTRAALDIGVRGYVLKVNAGEDLIPAVYSALEGKTFVSPIIAQEFERPEGRHPRTRNSN